MTVTVACPACSELGEFASWATWAEELGICEGCRTPPEPEPEPVLGPCEFCGAEDGIDGECASCRRDRVRYHSGATIGEGGRAGLDVVW